MLLRGLSHVSAPLPAQIGDSAAPRAPSPNATISRQPSLQYCTYVAHIRDVVYHCLWAALKNSYRGELEGLMSTEALPLLRTSLDESEPSTAHSPVGSGEDAYADLEGFELARVSRAALERRLVRKLDIRMSILAIIYILNYVSVHRYFSEYLENSTCLRKV